MLRRLAEWLLKDNRYAIIALLLCSLLLLVPLPGDFLVGIIVGLITLKRGPLQGLYLLLILALLAIGVTWQLHEFNIFVFLLIRSSFVWLGALLFRRFYSWSATIEVMMVLGLLVILFIHFVVPDLSSIWQHALENYLLYWKNFKWGPSPQEWQHFVNEIVPMVTGLAVLFSLSGVIFQLLLGRWWLSKLHNGGGFSQELAMIRISRIASLISLIAILVISFYAKNLIDYLPVLFLPFIISGCSLLYFIIMVRRNWWPAFLIIGILSIFLFLPTIFLLVLLSFIDSWINLRLRLNLNTK